MKKIVLIILIIIIIFTDNIYSQWKLINSNFLREIVVDNNNVLTDDNMDRFLMSTDNGTTWLYDKTFESSSTLYILGIKNQHIFLRFNDGDSCLMASHDLGKNWEKSDILKYQVDGKLIFDNDTMYLGAEHLFCKSEDFGDSFQKMGVSGAYPQFVKNGCLWITSGMFASCYIACSCDNGKTWEPRNNGIENIGDLGDAKMYVSENMIYVYYGDDGLFYSSSDNGLNWSLNHKFTSSKDTAFLNIVTCGDNLFATYERNPIHSITGVLFSKDYGKTWVQVNNGLLLDENNLGNGIDLNDNYIFVAIESLDGYGVGMYRAKLKDCQIDISNDVPERLEEFSFSISPNPAESYISISIPPEYQTQQIKIYSIEGIEVYKEPSEGLKPSEGYKIDVSGFVPGVYYLKVGTRVLRFIKL